MGAKIMFKKVLSTIMILFLGSGISYKSASSALPPFWHGGMQDSSPQIMFFLGNENQNKKRKELILANIKAQFTKLVLEPFNSLSSKIDANINDSHKGISKATNLKNKRMEISKTVNLYHSAIDSALYARFAHIPSYENLVELNAEIQNLEKELDTYLQQHTHK